MRTHRQGSWRLGKRKEAGAAFDKIVDVGLEANPLPVKLLVTPNTTNVLAVANLQTQYGIGLKELAQQVTKRPGCVKVVGHTSRTGTAVVNDSLSQRRATTVMQSLGRQNKQLGTRVSAEGSVREKTWSAWARTTTGMHSTAGWSSG